MTGDGVAQMIIARPFTVRSERSTAGSEAATAAAASPKSCNAVATRLAVTRPGA